MVGSSLVAALLTGAAASLVVFLPAGIYRAAQRSASSHPRLLAAALAAGLVAWLGVTAAIAESGRLDVWSAVPPRWPLLPLTALVTFALFGWKYRGLLSAIPAWQPVALQTFRVAVELAFWRLHAEGLAPVQVTFEGRNFDALAGLTAPLVAAGIAARWVGRRAVAAWNLAGLALLLNAIGTVATSAPGPLRLDRPGEPFAAVAAWPVVWIPALLAPAAIALHVVSIAQARSGRAE